MSGQRWVLAEHTAQENSAYWCDKLRLGDKVKLTDGRVMELTRVYEKGNQRFWEATDWESCPVSIGHWAWVYGGMVIWHKPREER